jgi:uncharacterized protein
MQDRKTIQNNYVIRYFLIVFLISWAGAFSLVAGKLFAHQPIPAFDGILMFPIMLLGPFLSGIILTYINGGKSALRSVWQKLDPTKSRAGWWLALLIPPAAILFTLLLFSVTVSKEYQPHIFVFGFLFGIPAGTMEEVGWMGFAFPNMQKRKTNFSNAVQLGLIWSLWHLPVINFLGTASPHGVQWFSFFLAFASVMTAMRVIIVWVYCNTGSLLLCQLMHISSTGFLVTLSPSPLNIYQEPLWYFGYALVLWSLVALIVSKFGKNLVAVSDTESSHLQKDRYKIEQQS